MRSTNQNLVNSVSFQLYQFSVVLCDLSFLKVVAEILKTLTVFLKYLKIFILPFKRLFCVVFFEKPKQVEPQKEPLQA